MITYFATFLLIIQIVDQAFASFIGCTSKTLDRTDHNNLCKFSNKDDANFLLVSGSLHSMVRKLRQRLGGSYV
jgi:DNA recombination-dependent growth factor C